MSEEYSKVCSICGKRLTEEEVAIGLDKCKKDLRTDRADDQLTKINEDSELILWMHKRKKPVPNGRQFTGG